MSEENTVDLLSVTVESSTLKLQCLELEKAREAKLEMNELELNESTINLRKLEAPALRLEVELLSTKPAYFDGEQTH